MRRGGNKKTGENNTMKKILSLVMAAAMAMGMTTTAFAADNKVKELTFGSTNLYTYDDKTMTQVAAGDLTPGETYYLYLAKGDALGGAISPVTKLSDLDNYRLSYTASEGKNVINSVKFSVQTVNKMLDTGNLGFTTGKNAFIAIQLKDTFSLEEQDMSFSISVSGKNDAHFYNYADSGMARPDITGERDVLNYTYVAAYASSELSNGYFTVSDGMVLEFDADADDVILCFDKDVEVAGNMKGQKKVFVRMATEHNATEEKYPDATIRFFEGDKDTFRRDVKVTIPYDSNNADKAPFIYEVASNGALTAVKGAKYDEELGAFVFSTKTLGNYIINDTELKSVVDSSNDSSTPKPEDGTIGGNNGSETNPGTGANDFVGVAVALAAIAVAGIAAAKSKK